MFPNVEEEEAASQAVKKKDEEEEDENTKYEQCYRNTKEGFKRWFGYFIRKLLEASYWLEGKVIAKAVIKTKKEISKE